MPKKYISENAELMKEWDREANNKKGLDPKHLLIGSGQKAWWICSKGHKWLSVIRDKISRNQKCPYCYGRKVLTGFNDLATINPKIAKEWNYEKNKSLRPDQIKASSPRKVWWKCAKGHEWAAQISNRIRGDNCPYCGHRKILAGFNDLSTTHPQIAKEWNYERNAPLLPTQVFGRSAKKVWWICPTGHEYQSAISIRKLGSCPICSREQQTSFPEQAIFYYLLKYNKNPENRYRVHGIECDIYLKDLNISIEYDGGRYHKNTQKDINKIKKLHALGIKTINIRGRRCPELKVEGTIIYQRKSETEKDLENAIRFIFSNIDPTIKPNINIEKDRIVILENALSIEKKNSLANLNPRLLKEWNYEKNGSLKPEFFTSTSGKKVWWKCAKGHEWTARISNRVLLNRDCPYCSNQKVLYGYNDLETVHPELAKEWNYEKNAPLTPRQYITGSNKIVWWQCSKGHEWKASIASRIRGASLRETIKGTQCPYCSNQKVQTGFNDLATTHPQLAKEWNYEKNDSLRPTQIVAGSNKKVWWKCTKGHEWKTSIANRQRGTKCPYCLNHKIISGENDLASQHPEFLKEWDYEKNHPLLPTQIGSGSAKKVWWKCVECGYGWQTSITNRVRLHSGCPRCSGRVPKTGINDLQTKFPELAKDWCYEKNAPLTPRDVTPGSGKKVWWKCANCGHIWQRTVYERSYGSKCPHCHGLPQLPLK